MTSTQATQTRKCSYRKTQSGKWAVMGPVDVIHVGATVTVTKADGTTKTETIGSVGRPFDGLVYGYPTAPAATRPASVRRHASGRCSECGGALTDFDRQVSCRPDTHVDCA